MTFQRLANANIVIRPFEPSDADISRLQYPSPDALTRQRRTLSGYPLKSGSRDRS